METIKRYVRDELKDLNTHTPADDKLSRLHKIYDELEGQGYSTQEVKIIIDSVIVEKINQLQKQLMEKLDRINQ